MNKLEIARKEISSIDAEIAKLFEKRMEICRLIAEYKEENGIPIRDQSREKEMLKAYRSFISGNLCDYYLDFVEHTIEISCRYQESLLHGIKEEH